MAMLGFRKRESKVTAEKNKTRTVEEESISVFSLEGFDSVEKLRISFCYALDEARESKCSAATKVFGQEMLL